MFIRVIRFRWLPGHADEASRLARLLVGSAQGQPGLRTTRVLRSLDGGAEGLVVFEWETRAALEAHAARTTLERLAPWAVPLLNWRTDQAYEVVPSEAPTAAAPPS